MGRKHSMLLKFGQFVLYYKRKNFIKTFHKNFDLKTLLKKNFMAPFYGWGSTASRLEPLRGGSLLFTTKN